MTATIHDADGVRVVHGDAVVVLPQLDLDPTGTVIITDPVWPNAPPGSFGVEDPCALFAAVAALFPRVCRRAVVQLGCASDPRFLASMPGALPFVRVCWLRYACPSYLGTVLNSGDVAYVFGSREHPANRTVMGGEVTSRLTTTKAGKPMWHPMPRQMEHVRWLVDQFTQPEDTVVDPFAGSGTTLLAARDAGRRTIGIEVSETYARGIVARLTEQGRLFRVEGVV